MAKGGMEKPPGGDHNPGYADQGEWKACPAVPKRRVQRLFEV